MKAAIILVLLGAVLGSAVSVVGTQHAARDVFMEIERLKKERDLLNEEWSRLQIEHSAWTLEEHIERTVREDLDMRLPDNDSRVFLVP